MICAILPPVKVNILIKGMLIKASAFCRVDYDQIPGGEDRRGIDMNKTELVEAIAKKADISKKDAEAALKAFTDTVGAQLKKGDKIQLVGFGTFEVSKRAARTGKNPQTGEAIKIAASKSPKFKAGKALKDLVNKK